MSERIKISKEFKGAMGGVWLGKEIEIPDGADDIAEFIRQNERLEQAWMAMNPQINWASNPVFYNLGATIPSTEETIQQPKEERIKSFIELINSKYQTKTTIENLRSKIEELNNPELTEAFNNKLKSFE